MVLVAYRDGGTDESPRYSIAAGTQFPPVRPGDRITIDQGFRLFRAYLDTSDAELTKRLTVDLPQYAWDAVSSFAYNVGGGGAGFVCKTINEKGIEIGALDMAVYARRNPGLLKGIARRRGEEIFRCTHDWYGDLTHYKLWRENPRTTHYELVPFPETI